jgi:phytoene/squalene synthetase
MIKVAEIKLLDQLGELTKEINHSRLQPRGLQLALFSAITCQTQRAWEEDTAIQQWIKEIPTAQWLPIAAAALEYYKTLEGYENEN